MKKIALVGKPNVGKSSLFNRIIGHKKAIVDDAPGITRDRNYATASWVGRAFSVIDTGGILKNVDAPFQEVINQQVNYAIDEADIILFIVSEKEGINAQDQFIAKLLKTKAKGKKIILVVNKAENYNHSSDKTFYNLKFGSFFPISCTHGIGLGDLLDEVVKQLDKTPERKEVESFKFCIIGRPNVGKSSLVNTLIGQERVIVSPIANATRDSIDCTFKYHGKSYTIIDTAGIRRKGKMSANVDKYSYLRTQEAISRSNLIIIMLDGSEEFNEQDEVIAGLAHAANIPTIIVVNKWDLVKKENNTMSKFEKLIRADFDYLSWAPIVFISAKDNKRVHTIFSTIENIYKELKTKVATSALNEVVAKAQILNPPPKFKGNRINIHYGTQVESNIPTFVLFTNDPKYLHFSYARYIENQIRQAFGLLNVPITVYYKDKNARIRK